MHWSKVCFLSNLQSKSIWINFSAFDRFAETEAIAVLSILVSQFKLTIKEEPQFAAETFEQRKTRILSTRLGLTTTWVFLWMMDFILMNVFFGLPLTDLFVFLWFSLVVHEVAQRLGEGIKLLVSHVCIEGCGVYTSILVCMPRKL